MLLNRDIICLSSEPSILKVFHWNTLSDQLSGFFPSVNEKYLDWSFRQNLLRHDLLLSSADILCLSEVDHFEDFIQPTLGPQGYRLLFKRKKSWHRDGLCIAYKEKKLRLIQQESIYFPKSNQFALAAVFLLGTIQILVVTTHLKSGPEHEISRLEQVKYLLEKIQKFNIEHIVMCGDFNCEPRSLSYDAVVLSKFSFKSTYFSTHLDKSEPEITTYKKREDEEEFNTIDYIFVRGFKVRDVLKLPSLKQVSEMGLPSKDYPSDHLSLMCSLGLDFDSKL